MPGCGAFSCRGIGLSAAIRGGAFRAARSFVLSLIWMNPFSSQNQHVSHPDPATYGKADVDR